MLKPPRKTLVIGLGMFIAAVTAVFAFHPIRDAIGFPFLSPAEKQVIGKWRAQMIGGINVTTIHADHTWSSVGGSCLGDDFEPIVGRWRVDGSDIVFSLDAHQFGDLATPDPSRCSIQQLIDGDRQTCAWIEQSQKK